MTGSGKGGPSGGLQRAAAVVVAAEAAGAIPERVMAVEVTPHEDAQAGAGAPPGLLGDLPRHAIGRHDVVAADDALVLHAEDLIELDAPERHEGRARVCGRPAEFGIEAGQELLAQIARLAAATVVTPASRSSLTRRSCRVRLTRSLRPRAWGEWPRMCSMPRRVDRKSTR